MVVYIPKSTIMLVDKIVGLLVQGSLRRRTSSCLASTAGIGVGSTGDRPGSTLQELLNFPIIKRKLPNKWVCFVHFEDTDEREDSMNTVLGPTTATGALDLGADLDLELPPTFILNRQFRRTIFLDQEESLAEGAIIVVHEGLNENLKRLANILKVALEKY